MSYEDNEAKAIQELKPLLTPEFLETLRTAVKTAGWNFDMNETVPFTNWCYELAEKSSPETNPLEY